MSQIDAIGAVTSSLSASLQDLAASAHNIANLRTAKPTSEDAFLGEQVIRSEGVGGGVATQIAPKGTAEGVVLSEPDHPAADAEGLVRYPDIDVGAEMVNMLIAQRGVEANVATIHRAVDSYRELLAVTTQHRAELNAAS
jgi:flagellar basal-body rod protein FlgC